MSKRFDVSRPDGKPRFRVTDATDGPRWIKQDNDYDCGPCMIYNLAKALNINMPRGASNIAGIRRLVNEKRDGSRAGRLPSEGWFNVFDVSNFLEDHIGIKTEMFMAGTENRAAVMEEVRANLSEKPFDLIFTTIGRHYRGITPGPRNGVYLLHDSFKNAPEEITTEELWTIIGQTIGTSNESRSEHLVVGRRKKKFVARRV